MPFLRQYSFASGEISPAMRGRHDLPGYQSGTAKMRNFLPSRTGAAVSRPGTRYIAETKVRDGNIRLVPFYFAAPYPAYLLEVGDGYIRIRFEGTQVAEILTREDTADPPPWPHARLDLLTWAQVGDVLFLAHPDCEPMILRREAHATWTLKAFDFDLRAVAPPSPAPAFVVERPTDPGHDDFPLEDTENLARPWQWAFTTVFRRRDGTTYESLPEVITKQLDWADPPPMTPTYSTLPDPLEIIVTKKYPVALNFYVGGLWDGSQDEPIGTRIYRGRKGLFGFVGEVKGSPSLSEFGSFLDEGREPDFEQQPPEGTNPFEVLDGSGALERTEHPATVAFYEGRLVFGGTAERPGTLWFSRSNDLANFDQPTPSSGSAAVELTLASRKREQIRALVGIDRLLAFTSAGVWAVAGANGMISAADLNVARVQSEDPCAYLPPILEGNAALFVHRNGRGVSELAFNADRGSFVPSDLSLQAEHLFVTALLSWDRATSPWHSVFAATTHGRLLSLSYTRESIGWAAHDTYAGSFRQVCVIPEGDSDAVYVEVRRNFGAGGNRRYIERFQPLESREPRYCLDCATATTLVSGVDPVVSGLDHLEGLPVWAVLDGEPQGPYTVTGGEIQLESDGEDLSDFVTVGLPFTADLELLDVSSPKAQGKTKRVTRALLAVEGARGLLAGQDFDHLTAWRQRAVSHDFGPIPAGSEMVEILISGTWTQHGRVAIRQAEPLPVTILGVLREVEVGG